MTEANFDGLVGLTHNYAGLAYGNVASERHAKSMANPRAAALQGLEKMKLLASLGVKQGIFPPQPRPDFRFLHALGFKGSTREVIAQVSAYAPQLLAYCYSSSGMWAANAATVAPSADSMDGRVHFTPANLTSTAHRALESRFTSVMLKRIFAGEAFVHHDALPAGPLVSDEGAANHTRLLAQGRGLHVFVYGRDALQSAPAPVKYPARQTLQASEAVARLHRLNTEDCLFLQQHPRAIDAGVFHNDVIAVGHESLYMYHEAAYAGGDAVAEWLRKKGIKHILHVDEAELSLADTVATYLFNSQLVSTPEDMVLIAPYECAEHTNTRALIERWVADEDNPISAVHYVDLKQSMQNGGGPACLRLRVPLQEREWDVVAEGVKFTEALHARLTEWVNTYYRDRLSPEDLRDPQLADEARAALAALEDIIGLKGLYANFH